MSKDRFNIDPHTLYAIRVTLITVICLSIWLVALYYSIS